MAIKITHALKAGPRKEELRKIQRFAKLPLVTLISAVMWNPAHALEFSLGEVEGQFNSNISIGSSWRMDERDPALISVLNGGTAPGNAVNDDGNLNFNKNDSFSKIIKGVHDLSLTYNNMGVFLRGKYWYDTELKDESQHWGNGPNGYSTATPLNDDGFNDYAKFSGVELLDAFVYTNFDLGEMPATVRLGRQVVSWGESTFIQGGINAINPIDVAAFRRPGAEIKEGLLPVNMLFGSLGVTDNLSAEAYYQLEWEETAIDGCGTYFSTVDYIAQGCNTLTLGSAGPANDPDAVAAGLFVERGTDVEAKDEGQFGVALRYFAEELNSTEFGFYYMNYHSRLPVASGMTTGSTQIDNTGVPFIPGNMPFEQNPTYFSEYLEDIELLGLSFATTAGEIALSGEVSHQKDLPLQINGADLVGSILTAGTQMLPNGEQNPMNAEVFPAYFGGSNTPAGTAINGYDRFDVSQAQMTAIMFVDQVMAASRVTLIGELAFNHIHSFNNADEGGIRYGRASEFGQDGTDGFTTQDSFGYRARAIFSYPDAVAGINLSPSIALAHDVEGYSPVNTGFVEGRKAVSLGVRADYRNTYNANLSYTYYDGGDYDILKDRDFLSLSFGVSF
ncbi:MAG: DUF1302 domain-containing protein [Motiliproteus sp.]